MSFSDAKQVAENLKAAYPTDTFLAVAGVGGYCTGKCILKFGGWLVYKLTSSSAPSIADEKVKEKAFCWVFDSKSITNIIQRRDFIHSKLGNIFPSHCRTLFVFPEGQSTEYYISGPSKGTAFFDHQYCHAVLIILN